MAVLTPGMAGPELARHDVAAAGEASQRLFDLPYRQSPARRRVGAEEGDVCPRPADQEGRQWLARLFEKRVGKTNRQCHAQRVAITRRVLGGDPPLLVGDADPSGAAFPLQLSEPFRADPAGLGFSHRQVAEPPEPVGSLIGVPRPALFKETLQLQFEDLDRPWIEQLPKFFGAE